MASYDPHTALIVIDVQNDFAAPEGSLHVPDAEQILPLVNREIERAAKAGAAVLYTRDWHPPATPHFARDGGTWRRSMPRSASSAASGVAAVSPDSGSRMLKPE